MKMNLALPYNIAIEEKSSDVFGRSDIRQVSNGFDATAIGEAGTTRSRILYAKAQVPLGALHTLHWTSQIPKEATYSAETGTAGLILFIFFNRPWWKRICFVQEAAIAVVKLQSLPDAR